MRLITFRHRCDLVEMVIVCNYQLNDYPVRPMEQALSSRFFKNGGSGRARSRCGSRRLYCAPDARWAHRRTLGIDLDSLDADASNVRIEFAYDDLAGGMSKIHVYDDGDGFSRDEAKALFGNLGGSWKRRHRATKRNHGQEGRGRYKAFALGKSVEWNVCYAAEDGNRSFRIVLLDADLTDVSIGSDDLTPERGTGVVVTVGDLRHDYKAFGTAEGVQELTETFALYLENYKDARVLIAGEQIDPAKAIATRQLKQLQPVLIDGNEYLVELEIVEWKRETKRTLYLCSSTGFPLDQVETRFHVPGFAFSGYLKSKYVDVLHEADAISLSEMDAPLTKTIEEARTAIKDYFRDRAAD
jgi:Histidine kinase-, DNA gyrase B-, and HSP90-like ATPase